MDVEHTVNETVPFLRENRKDVRYSALQILHSVCAVENGLVTIASHATALSDLLHVLGEEESEHARATIFTILANAVGEVPDAIAKLDVEKWADACIAGIDGSTFVETRLILLTNITTVEDACLTFLGVGGDFDAEGTRLRPVLDGLLANPCPANNDGSEDLWQYAASVVCNATRTEAGRRVVLRKSTGYVQKLIPEIQSPNAVRRRGVIGTFRNCLFDEEFHFWLVNEVGLLTPLLQPLMGLFELDDEEKEGMDPALVSQAPGAHTESQDDIITQLLECVLLLCQKRSMREYMRTRHVYTIIKHVDTALQQRLDAAGRPAEEYTETEELIYKIVNFLQRDEEGESKNPFELAAQQEAKQQMANVANTSSGESLVEQIKRNTQASHVLEEID